MLHQMHHGIGHMVRGDYAQAGGTHPTGMHSCLFKNLPNTDFVTKLTSASNF